MIDHDDYAYDSEPNSGAWKKTLYKVLLSVGVVGGFAAAVVFAYSGESSRDAREPKAQTNATTAPLIAADRRPVKVRPADPGGAKVPNRNSDIYRRLDASKPSRPPASPADRKSARRGDRSQFSEDSLAPGAGDPKRSKQANDGDVDARPRLRSRAARAQVTANTRRVAARGPTCEAQQPASGRSMLAELNRAGVKLNQIAPGAGVQTSRQGRAARRGRSTAELIGPYRIQLGAYRSAVSAQRNWDTLVKKNNDLLGRLNMVIERVHLGPKGVVYRLQAGPLRTERAARTLCQSLARRRIGCILVAS